MKSIAFTVFRDKLLSGEKEQTCRALFIPQYVIGEIVKIDFKANGRRETLFHAKITEIYPKQIKDFTYREAIMDGFESILDFQKGIMKINSLKSFQNWTFIIRFKKAYQDLNGGMKNGKKT
jgi:hypothetical protein